MTTIFFIFKCLSTLVTFCAFVGEIIIVFCTLLKRILFFRGSILVARREPIDAKHALVSFTSAANWFDYPCLFWSKRCIKCLRRRDQTMSVQLYLLFSFIIKCLSFYGVLCKCNDSRQTDFRSISEKVHFVLW